MSGRDFDAVILGGGPAGATAAGLLAQHGRRCVVLEREQFPRYHIGESLLPYCWHTLDRLGMVDKLNATAFVKKYSVQFASVSGRMSEPFHFDEHLNGHPSGQSWQVVRSEFDRMMLDNARQLGAEVRLGANAKTLVEEDGRYVGVAYEQGGQRHELRAPITIDCTGRNAFTIAKLGWRKRDPQLSKISIWTYYKGGIRGEARDEGATTVAFLPGQGWFWHIPLQDDVISLGVVAERDYLYRDPAVRELGDIFAREVGENGWIKKVMQPAKQFGEYWITGDFSYRSEYSAADGLVLAGDAFAFLDPVFSSGVFLALTSGAMVADAVHEALEANDPSAARFARYSDELCDAIEAMRKLVYAFYDENFRFGKLLKKHPHVHGDLTDCLIGHLFKDFTELFNRVGEFAELPEPLPHGRPLVTAK